MEYDKKQELRVHMVLLAVAFSWGFNNIAMKLGFRYVSPQQFNSIRLLLTAPFMLYFAFFLPNRVKFTRRDFYSIVGLGALGLGMFQILFPIGLNETSAPIGAVLMATLPVHVVILVLVFRLEKPSVTAFVGIALTMIGLAVIGSFSQHNGTGTVTTVRGIVFMVTSEFGYAIYTTFLKPYMKKYSALQVTGLVIFVSTLMYLGIYWQNLIQLDIRSVHPIAWMNIFYSGFIGLLISNVAWNKSIVKIGSTRVSVYGNLPTAFALLLGAIFLKELLTFIQVIGALILLSGVILVQLRHRREPSLIKS